MAEHNRKALSPLESNILRHVADAGSMSVREAADGFGQENGFARTTVQTLMERLRKKGYLVRRKVEGTFHYSPRLEQNKVDVYSVSNFVERALGGSVSPLVSFLVSTNELSKSEIKILQDLAKRLEKESEQ